MARDLRMVERHCVVHRRSIEDRLEEMSIVSWGGVQGMLVRQQKRLEAKTEDLEERFGLKQEMRRIGE